MVWVTAAERTCIGCRRKREQAELVRLKVVGGRVVPAAPGAPGRSAYLCPDPRCLEAAERRRAFARAFRAAVTVDPAVREAVAGDATERSKDAAPRHGGTGAAGEERR